MGWWSVWTLLVVLDQVSNFDIFEASTNNSAVSASVAANPDVPGGIPLNLIVPDVITQVAGYLLQKNASQTARLGTTLFIIVAGGNDVQIAPAIPASGPVSTIGHVISTLKTNG